MKHIKNINEFLNEDLCEGDMEDMLSFIRGITKEFEIKHYGFDYIEIKLKHKIDEAEILQKEIVDMLLKKFGNNIREIYTEETGWFKIYLK